MIYELGKILLQSLRKECGIKIFKKYEIKTHWRV